MTNDECRTTNVECPRCGGDQWVPAPPECCVEVQCAECAYPNEHGPVVLRFGGTFLTKEKIGEGLFCHGRAVQQLCPEFLPEGTKIPAAALIAALDTPYPPYPSVVCHYNMRPPEDYTDRQKWEWLGKLLRLIDLLEEETEPGGTALT